MPKTTSKASASKTSKTPRKNPKPAATTRLTAISAYKQQLIVLLVVIVGIAIAMLVNSLRGPQALGAQGTAEAFLSAMVHCDAAGVHKYAPLRFANDSTELQNYKQQCAQHPTAGTFHLVKNPHDQKAKTVEGQQGQTADFVYEVSFDNQTAEVVLQLVKLSPQEPWQVAMLGGVPNLQQQ